MGLCIPAAAQQAAVPSPGSGHWPLPPLMPSVISSRALRRGTGQTAGVGGPAGQGTPSATSLNTLSWYLARRAGRWSLPHSQNVSHLQRAAEGHGRSTGRLCGQAATTAPRMGQTSSTSKEQKSRSRGTGVREEHKGTEQAVDTPQAGHTVPHDMHDMHGMHVMHSPERPKTEASAGCLRATVGRSGAPAPSRRSNDLLVQVRCTDCAIVQCTALRRQAAAHSEDPSRRRRRRQLLPGPTDGSAFRACRTPASRCAAPRREARRAAPHPTVQDCEAQRHQV